jgi:hypothetical protein
MRIPPIITTRDPQLSQWQSLAESLQKFIHKDLSISEIRGLPFMQGLYAHVLSTQGKDISNLSPEVAKHAAKSKYYFDLVTQQPMVLATTTTTTETRDYSDADSEWDILAVEWWAQASIQDAKTASWYDELFMVARGTIDVITLNINDLVVSIGAEGAQWLLKNSDKKIQKQMITYRKWNKSGASNNGLDYSLIDWKLPNDAKVVMLGDWGTSNPDCKALLKAIWDQERPDAFVHLGDIYYSGSKEECDDNFYNIFQDVAKDLGIKTVPPVFTIPGNHEYYSFGEGFYYLIDKMNTGNQKQDASYFCLRTEDSQWQFLGMDTGQDDNNPYVTHLYPFAPQLYGDQGDHGELVWHQDKLKNFSGKTIMMSHHQLFTPDEANLIDSDVEPYFNRYLHGYFAPYFNKISAWYWGHEHSLALYNNNIFGLSKGRLLGSSSYEVPDDAGYYNTDYPMVTRQNYTVPVDTDGFYYHACAVFDFKRTNPTDAISASYYSYQSWGQDETQTDFALKLIHTESIGGPTTPALKWSGNKKVNGSDIESKNAPSLTQSGHHLYMAFNDTDDGQIKLSSYDLNTNNNDWADHTNVSAGGNAIYTDHTPSITYYNSCFYILYADSNNNDTLTYVSNSGGSLGTWSSPKLLGSSSVNYQVDSGISTVWIGGQCYFCFTDKNSTTIIVGHTDFSTITILNLPWKPVDIDNPTITASGTTLQLFYTSSTEPSYITWASLDTPNSTWTQHYWINNGSIAHTPGTPQATTGLSAVVESNGNITVFYGNKNVDGDKTINWVTYAPAPSSLWSGGVSLPRLSGDKATPFMQHSAASIALSGGGIYLLFVSRSDDTVRYVVRN